MTQWIKCSERMPKKETPVLISAKHRWSFNPLICVAQWEYLTEKFPVYWECVGASGYECENDFSEDGVTHWMPLPEPPEE